MKYRLDIKSNSVTIRRRNSNRAKRMRLTAAGGELVLTTPIKVSEKEMHYFLDQKSDWILKMWMQIQETARLYPDIARNDKGHYDAHRRLALLLSRKKVEEWSVSHVWDYNQVRVRRMKSRWGSCTAKRNLHFNYKILFLPQDLQNYLVVHELCHLKHPNHSAEFWASVEGLLPDYKEHHAALREIG